MSASQQSPAFVALVQATAGAAGGLIAAAALMPLEVVKTRIQVSAEKNPTTFGTFKDILQREGFQVLFSGITAKVIETSTKNFIYFYIYDALNTVMKRRTTLTTLVKLVIGFVAGVVNQSLIMPLEVVATKMQVDGGDGRGLLAVAREIHGKEGISGLFKGYWFNMILCINPAIQNTCFDKLKDGLLSFRAAQWRSMGKTFTYETYPSLAPLESFCLGALAKSIATIVTFPLVRLKTLLQAGKKSVEFTDSKDDSNSSPLRMLGQLYQGIESTIVKSVLQAALLYMAKDQIESSIVTLFKISMNLMRRRSGRVKLGVTSGRPLPSL